MANPLINSGDAVLVVYLWRFKNHHAIQDRGENLGICQGWK